MKECKVYMYSVLDQQRYNDPPDHIQLPAHVNYLLCWRGIQCILKKNDNHGYVNNHPSDSTCLALEWNFQKLCYQHARLCHLHITKKKTSIMLCKNKYNIREHLYIHPVYELVCWMEAIMAPKEVSRYGSNMKSSNYSIMLMDIHRFH